MGEVRQFGLELADASPDFPAPFGCVFFRGPPTWLVSLWLENQHLKRRGIYFSFFSGFFVAFGFLAFWLLGFLAWLLGFWAFRLFVGFCSFWRLWLFASFAFTVPLWAFWLLHPFIGFWDLASRIISITSSALFESSLLRTNPPATVLDCLQSNCIPV